MRVPGFFASLATTMPDGVDVLRNLYREDTGDPERPYRFVRRPGKLARVTGLHGPVRGGIAVGSTAYVIAGERFYAIDTSWTATELGAVSPDTRQALMIANGSAGNQVAGVSGGKLWLYNSATGLFGQVTDADLPADILGIVHTDLTAVAWFRDSRAFRISGITDLTAWAGGDVAERSQYVDNIQTIIADQKELQIIGALTQETWWPSGNASFPYEPVPNALSRQGSLAVHGGCLVGDAPYWVGQSPEGRGVVFRVRGGYTPERVSNHWVERRIQQLLTVSDAYTYSYEEHGHRFFVLNFPQSNATLAFDEAVDPKQGWAERTWHNPYTGLSESDLGRCHFTFNGVHLVGSRRDGTIYEQGLQYADDDGVQIQARRRFRGPRNDGKGVSVSEVRLDAQVGVGLTSGQGSAPVVGLRKSKDGGRTWGPELQRSLGAIGEYGTRVRWQRLGVADDPAWDLTYSDPTVLGLNDFHVDAEGLAH